MSLDRPGIKQRAKEIIAGSKPRVLWVAAVYLILSISMQLLGQRVMSVNVSESEAMNYMNYVAEGNYEYALQYLDGMTPPRGALLIYVLLSLTIRVVWAGFLIFLLNTVRSNSPVFGNLLDAFGFFPKVIVLYILELAITFLGAMLLFVPGIIAHYCYSQALYLLIDDPRRSPIQCLHESRLLMRGHKAELFQLDLSFIGWYLLLLIPTVGFAAQFWTTPYIATTKTLYFERLIGAASPAPANE